MQTVELRAFTVRLTFVVDSYEVDKPNQREIVNALYELIYQAPEFLAEVEVLHVEEL